LPPIKGKKPLIHHFSSPPFRPNHPQNARPCVRKKSHDKTRSDLSIFSGGTKINECVGQRRVKQAGSPLGNSK
jgi:hypothetical protein